MKHSKWQRNRRKVMLASIRRFRHGKTFWTAREQIERLRAEAEAMRAEVENYRWLRDKARHVPLDIDRYAREIMPDTRLRWAFPVLVSYDAIGQQISLDDAIKAAREREGGDR